MIRRRRQVSFGIAGFTTLLGPAGVGSRHPELCLRAMNREDPSGSGPAPAFCHVDDAARDPSTRGERSHGRIVNIGNGAEEVSALELAVMILARSGHCPQLEHLPAPEARWIAAVPRFLLHALTGFVPQLRPDG